MRIFIPYLIFSFISLFTASVARFINALVRVVQIALLGKIFPKHDTFLSSPVSLSLHLSSRGFIYKVPGLPYGQCYVVCNLVARAKHTKLLSFAVYTLSRAHENTRARASVCVRAT